MTDTATRPSRAAAIRTRLHLLATILWAASAGGWLAAAVVASDGRVAVLAAAGAVTAALAAWVWQRHGPGWQATLPMIPSMVVLVAVWFVWSQP